MLNINENVVKALMTLRGITLENMANLIHATEAQLWMWLEGAEASEEEKPSADREREILALLGLHENRPRGDVVHYWTIRENFLCNVRTTYAPLLVMLEVFGPAKVVHLARENDPAVTTEATAYFGLQFDTFFAILEVQGHAWRSIRFDPDLFSNLTWASSAPSVAIPDAEYDKLEPGALSVFSMHKRIQFSTEVPLWDSLRELALDRGIRAEEVITLLQSSNGDVLNRAERVEGVTGARVEVRDTPLEAPAVAVKLPPVQTPQAVATPPAVKQEAAVAAVPVTPVQVTAPSPAAPSAPKPRPARTDDFSVPLRRQ